MNVCGCTGVGAFPLDGCALDAWDPVLALVSVSVCYRE